MNTSTEILDRLADQGRKFKAGYPIPADGPVPPETIRRIQSDLRFMLDQPGVSLEKIARSLDGDFSKEQLRVFHVTDFTGDQLPSAGMERTARGVNSFIELIARRREAKLPDGFVETVVAKRMLLVIGKSIELCSIGLIYGDAGRGKSLTLEAAHQLYPGSILLRVRQTCRTPSTLCRQLARQLHLIGVSMAYQAEDRVINALKGSGRALLIDEAHKLTPAAIECLRDIHDETGAPVVLVGTIQLTRMIDDDRLFFGQLNSRIALRYNINESPVSAGDGPGGGPPLHTVEEIRRIYEADKIRFTDDARRFLTNIANLPGLGGLRLCTRLVQVAKAVAGASGASGGDKRIDQDLLRQVLRSMHGQSYAAARIEQPIERKAIKVA